MIKLLKFYFRYYAFRSLRKVKNIENVIQTHGFRIYTFRLEAPNDPVTKLIDQLDIFEYAEHHICFIATNEIMKGVFIKHNLSDDDRLELLFHEEAHIWYNHPNVTGFTEDTETQQEMVANGFLLKLKCFRRWLVVIAIGLVIGMLYCLLK